MASVVGLPEGLREHLATAALHLRRLRLLRGVTLLVLTLTLLGGAALLLDAWLDLPRGVRLLLFGAWLAAGAGVALFGLVLPLRRRPDAEALAAVIEAKYPDLGERLTTTVELAGARDSFHGAPAFVALLARETEARARRLDVPQAFPARRTKWLAAAALAALAAAVAPALFRPAGYADRGRRFLLAWQTPARVVPFVLDVSPGDAAAAVGRPLTFSVALRRTDGKTDLPSSCYWMRTDAAGAVTRRPMRAERSDTFTFKLESLAGDCRYRVEAGEFASPDYQITAVAPVELTADGTGATVTPPPYARAAVETQTALGLADLAALQHSRIDFDFHFTRPAVAASLEWTPAGKEPQVRLIPLELSDDRAAGRLRLPAVADGTFRLVLEAEHGVRTELGPRTLTVKPDLPPAFLKVSGTDALLAVQPYENLPLNVELADDVAVAGVELEYRVNDGPTQSEEIKLVGTGTRQARGHYDFNLSGKVREEDALRYRFKARDNRDVPEANLKPQVTYYPAEEGGQPRWRTLKIARRAEPLKDQEIAARKAEMDRQLGAVQRKVDDEREALRKLRDESRREANLTPEQLKALDRLRDMSRSVESDLRQLSRDAEEVADLARLAEAARKLADEEVRRSAKELEEGRRPPEAAARERNLQNADRELAAADRKLNAMRRQNEQLAKERLDRAKLETLADRQKGLARRAADQAAADPIKDPKGKEKTRDLQRDQRELAADLQRQTDESEALRQSTDAAQKEEARRLAERARELARAERDLAKSAEEAGRKRNQDALADLARKQQALADKADALARATRQPAQAANAKPLTADEAKKAAEALKRGDANPAVAAQDQAAKELDRLAAELGRAVEMSRDPKEAARQLARLQEGLRHRLNEETRKPDDLAPLAERVRELHREQAALRQAAAELSVPPGNAEAQKDQQEATRQAAAAAEALDKNNPRAAEARMKESRQTLDRLANRLPTLRQRQDQARAELAELRKRQDQLAKEAEEATREKAKDKMEQRLTEAARRQGEIADRLGKLDTPHHEAARDQAQKASRKAQNDLQKPDAPKVTTSQQEARRQLEQLEKALADGKPASSPTPAAGAAGMPDGRQAEQARQLAREQRALRDAVQKAAGNPSQHAETAAEQSRQGELRRQTEALGQDLQRLAESMPRHRAAQQTARQAAASTQHAGDAMRRAQDQGRQGQTGPAGQSRQQAAQNLEQAARQAEQAAGQMAGPPRGAQAQGSPQLGRDLRQAQDSINQAQRQLAQGQAQSAQAAMTQAAQSLQQAARQMSQPPSTRQTANGRPNNLGAPPGQGRPDPSVFGKEMKQYAGKSWGELPGELRTKIIQDVQARYGDDYARIIKLYFEELADKK